MQCPLRKCYSKCSVVATEFDGKADCFELNVLSVLLEYLGFVFSNEDWTRVHQALTTEAWARFDDMKLHDGLKAEPSDQPEQLRIKYEVKPVKVKSAVKSEPGASAAPAPAPHGLHWEWVFKKR